MARHLACLTFDFDAISNWIHRGALTPTQISRGEFGLVGAARILDLMKDEGIATTWFIPGHTLDTYPEMCRRVHAEGHEIGNHGYLHEPPATLSGEAEEEAVLLRGNGAIRRITGGSPKGYRSPAWDLSPYTVPLLLKHGFTYDTSMMAHDCHPYRARQGDDIAADRPVRWGAPTKLIEMPIAWSTDDFPHFEYSRRGDAILPGLRRGKDVLENWVDDFRYMAREEEWGVLTYTFHPQVSGRGHRMLVLERLIHALREMGAVFVRMDAAVGEFVQWERSRKAGSA